MAKFAKYGWMSLLATSGACLGCFLWVSRAEARLPASAMVGDIPVGGLAVSQVSTPLSEVERFLDQMPIRVSDIRRKTFTFREWGLELDKEATVQAVRKAWDQVNAFERVFGNPQIHVQPVWRIDEEQFHQRLKSLRFLERAPENAAVRWRNGRVVMTGGKLGRALDGAGTQRNLETLARTIPIGSRTQVASSSGVQSSEIPTLQLKYRTSEPSVSREQLRAITAPIATYTTRFPGYQADRNANIRLAAQALDGKVLMPGEKLSYNQAVGTRTGAKGYRMAPVIIQGEKKLGIGGGICQVSSTLFNAALLADMKIVQRHNHSIPIGYVPLGRDATATDGGLDLVIQNNFDTPIAISTEVQRSALVTRILGAPVAGKRVELKAERLGSVGATRKTVRDPNLPAGVQKVVKSGSSGARARLWRLVYEDGALVRREVVATSYYRAQPQVVAVGTGKPKPKPAPVVGEVDAVPVSMPGED